MFAVLYVCTLVGQSVPVDTLAQLKTLLIFVSIRERLPVRAYENKPARTTAKVSKLFLLQRRIFSFFRLVFGGSRTFCNSVTDIAKEILGSIPKRLIVNCPMLFCESTTKQKLLSSAQAFSAKCCSAVAPPGVSSLN